MWRAVAPRLGRWAAGAAIGLSSASVYNGAAAAAEPAFRFDDTELRAATAERTARQQMFMEYLETVRSQVQRAAAVQDSGLIDQLKEEISAKQEAILFDALPGERRRYLLQYGCAAWTQQALSAIAAFSPIIEIGAGAGHWYRALSNTPAGGREAGGEASSGEAACVDVVAYDDGSEVPQAISGLALDFGVRRGGVDQLRLPEHAGRTLLLVYPPPGPMAQQCLNSYSGDHLLYVGEGRGGYNADAAFFNSLEARWRVKKVIPLRPFNGGYEKLYVLKRKFTSFRAIFR